MRVTEAQKKAKAKYEQSKKGKAVAHCYTQSKKGKAKAVRHARSEKGKVTNRRYKQSGKGKATDRRYKQSEKGILTDIRGHAKRKELGYKPINNWFEGSHGHHIDKENVLFIPAELHKSIKHRQDNLISMQAMNDAAFEWFYIEEVI